MQTNSKGTKQNKTRSQTSSHQFPNSTVESQRLRPLPWTWRQWRVTGHLRGMTTWEASVCLIHWESNRHFISFSKYLQMKLKLDFFFLKIGVMAVDRTNWRTENLKKRKKEKKTNPVLLCSSAGPLFYQFLGVFTAATTCCLVLSLWLYNCL